jgi:hypothetical protein
VKVSGWLIVFVCLGWLVTVAGVIGYALVNPF